MEDKVNDLKQVCSRNEKQIKDMEKQYKLAKETSIQREHVLSDKFDRPPNLEILRISTRKAVTNAAISDAIAPWLSEHVGINAEEWKVVAGNPPGKGFYVHFLQVPHVNARYVDSAMSKLKDDAGTWREFMAKAPDASNNKLRVEKDENPRARTQRRMAAVMLKTLLDDNKELENVHIRRNPRKCMVSIFAGDLGVCTMEPTSAEVAKEFFLWNPEAIDKLVLDKEELLDKTMLLLGRPEERIEWCV